MINFNEYCEDFLDQDPSLLSSAQLAEARKSYFSAMAGSKPASKAAKHPDASLKLAQLKEKVARFARDQQITCERKAAEYDVSLNAGFVNLAEAALADKKTTKAQYLDLITMNSEADRAINNQLKK